MAYNLQTFVQPAQALFGYDKKPFAHTHYEQLDSSQSSPYTPHQPTANYPGFWQDTRSPNADQRDEKALKKVERRAGLVFGIADVCSCVLTLFLESVMAYVLFKFYETRNIPTPGRSGPWSKDTQLWPTYMMAGVALATLVLSIASLVMMCREKKKNTKRAQLSVKVIRTVIHIGSWIALAAFYRIAKTGKDLWGWSCGDKAHEIQTYYTNTLHFDTLCKIQSSSWVLTVIEVLLKIVFTIVGFSYQFKLDRIKKAIARKYGGTSLEPMR